MSQVIAVTGGMGSGKSRVCDYLAKLCRLQVIDLDQVCRDLLKPGAAGWLALKENIGGDFYSPSGEINRPAFRSALFADKVLRSQVDALIHPLARAEMTARLSRTDARVLVEIPLLFEAGWRDDDWQVVVVYAEPSVCLQRVVARDNVSPDQARQAIAAQYPLKKKAELADHVIDNSGSWQDTCFQLQDLADRIGCRG